MEPPTSFISTWTCFNPPSTSSRSATTCLIWSLTESCLLFGFPLSESCRWWPLVSVGLDFSTTVTPEPGLHGPFLLLWFKCFCGTSVAKKPSWTPSRPLQLSSDPPFCLPKSWSLSLSSPPSWSTVLCPQWPFGRDKWFRGGPWELSHPFSFSSTTTYLTVLSCLYSWPLTWRWGRGWGVPGLKVCVPGSSCITQPHCFLTDW